MNATNPPILPPLERSLEHSQGAVQGIFPQESREYSSPPIPNLVALPVVTPGMFA